MKLLVDQNIARRVAVMLCDAGHDAVHVSDRGLAAAEEIAILELARTEERTIVSEDTDFGALLSAAQTNAPSFVLLRGGEPMAPEDQAATLIANLPSVEADLMAGAIVVIARGRLRVRPLPIRNANE